MKKQIVTAVEPVFLSPLADKITGFVQVSALTMLQHIFSSYRDINKIDLEENAVKTMGTYNPAETLAQIIKQLEKGREFAQAGGQKISNAMMISKGITLLAQTGISMMTSESGGDNPPTSRRGRNTSCFPTERTERKKET